jgi:3-dehydroquinate dehydratase / shikimate dehydrogenase
MTQLCISLTEETTAGLIDRMEELADLADLFEIRADLVLDLDLLTLLRAKTRPLLLTCRAASEGGRWEDADPSRRLTLLEAVRRGFDYVDVEYRSNLLDVMLEKSGHGLVVSYHDLESTPDDLPALYEAMCDRGADVVKIAVTPRSMADVGRLLALAAQAAKGPTPLVAIALGPLGTVSRVVGGRYGAPFTFASAAAGAEAAPGQLPAALMADLFRVRSITAKTRLFGILGSDVTKSLSPVLHNRAFQARGVDAVYVPLQADTLEGFLAALPALDLAGFSITRPYKVGIVRHLHEVEPEAALSASVNTVVVRNGKLLGSSTDGAGVLGPLQRRLDVKGRKVVIVGAGGAARAAALALHRKGAQVTVLARRADQAAALALSVGCAHGPVADLARHPWDVLINATPVGSAVAPDQTPVPAERHRPGTVVFDMVYDPLETRLLREAQTAGCTIIDGLQMLLAQAAVQFETWTGEKAPLDVMRSAALYVVQEQEA